MEFFTASPFSLVYHIPDQLLSTLSSTRAEDLRLLAVNIMLRLRIDCFDFRKAICSVASV
jgi:hypothetical protein